MPILDVEIVGEPVTDASLARRLADAAGAVLKSRPQGTWVRVRTLAFAHYAENEGGPPPGVSPVFVTVLKRENPTGDRLKEEIAALTKAIASVCGRSEGNVHVLYEAPVAGRPPRTDLRS